MTASDTVLVTATVTSTDGSTPSGTVVFTQFGADLGSATLAGDAGIATATVAVPGAQLTPGTGTITASWNGQSAATAVTVVAGSTAE